MKSSVTHSKRNAQRGATTMEYALLCFVILVVAAVGFRQLGHSVGQGATTAADNIK
jgi:Flp pilus assembly pilin Flp